MADRGAGRIVVQHRHSSGKSLLVRQALNETHHELVELFLSIRLQEKRDLRVGKLVALLKSHFDEPVRYLIQSQVLRSRSST